jgi:hypothetical protein
MLLSGTGHCMLLEAADGEPAIKQGIVILQLIIAILSTICMMGNKERKMIYLIYISNLVLESPVPSHIGCSYPCQAITFSFDSVSITICIEYAHEKS